MSDGNKIRHNLALAYANNKLQIALQRGERPQGLDLNDPAQAACVLASWYSDCLEQLINLEDSKIYSPSSMDYNPVIALSFYGCRKQTNDSLCVRKTDIFALELLEQLEGDFL